MRKPSPATVPAPHRPQATPGRGARDEHISNRYWSGLRPNNRNDCAVGYKAMTQAKTAAREAAHQFLHGYYDPGIVPVATLDKLESIILAQRAAVWREAVETGRLWEKTGAEAIVMALAAKAKEESE